MNFFNNFVINKYIIANSESKSRFPVYICKYNNLYFWTMTKTNNHRETRYKLSNYSIFNTEKDCISDMKTKLYINDISHRKNIIYNIIKEEKLWTQ